MTHMTNIAKATGAFALTWLAATASAATVELVLDIKVQTKLYGSWQNDSPHSYVDNRFKPTAFTMNIRFDLDVPAVQWVSPAIVGDFAFTSWEDPGAVFSTTPFSDALNTTPPTGARNIHTGKHIEHNTSLLSTSQDQDEPRPAKMMIGMNEEASWKTDAANPQDDSFVFYYGRRLELHSDSSPLSRNQLTPISGEGLLAVLQAQVGILQPGAFYEGNGLTTRNALTGGLDNIVDMASIGYIGDATIRSVTVVPEPGTFALGLLGLGGLIALRRRQA